MGIRPQKINPELTLYITAFLLALGVRLYHLGASPLTDSEAEWALQALQLAHPVSSPEIGPQPAYIILTGINFSLFGASNFMARFWPALAGSLLLLLPFCIRHSLGRTTAMILAFGLAMDPGLTAISRMAGSPMMAVGFGLSALGLWFAGVPILAGILGALALLSGPAIFAGILALAIPALVARSSFPRWSSQDIFQKQPIRILLFTGLVTFLAVGTFFFRYPQGLAAWFESFLVYLNGWRISSGVPPGRLAAALLFFQPFALIFALAAILSWLIRLRRESEPNLSPVGLALVWLLASLLLALFYPARQVTDLAWTLVPLWILAATNLKEYLPDRKPHPISLVQAALVLLFAGLFWSTLIATNQTAPLEGISWVAIRLAVMAGVIALGVLTTALVALGWSWRVSRDGTVWGLGVAFGIYLLMMMWSATQLLPHYPQELWSDSAPIQQADLFVQTMNDLSNLDSGFVDQIDVVSTIDTPSLRWILRDYKDTQFISKPPMGELPSIVITPGFEDESQSEAQFPELSAAYRGQDFAWWVLPSWSGALPPDIIRWLAFHEAPVLQQHIILWARSDIFPGGSLDYSPPLNDLE